MKCKSDKCENIPISLSEHCWDHLSNKEEYINRLKEAIDINKDLSSFNLRKVVLKNSHFEKLNLTKANLSQADFSGTHMFDTRLKGADLVGANFSNSDATHCDFRSADLTKANFTNARLWNADLSGTNLTECDLEDADLWNAKLFDVKLWHTNFEKAKFLAKKNFADNKVFDDSRINESGLLSAEESYRNLKKYFLNNGMYNDASCASFKEKTMERLSLKKKRSLHYIPSMFINILCGYGEKPYRIILSSLGTILLFAFLYYLLGAVENSTTPTYVLRVGDYIYYSTVTFTTVGYGDFIPKSSTTFRLMAAAEAFLGTFLTGLFIFTLARKYSAR